MFCGWVRRSGKSTKLTPCLLDSRYPTRWMTECMLWGLLMSSTRSTRRIQVGVCLAYFLLSCCRVSASVCLSVIFETDFELVYQLSDDIYYRSNDGCRYWSFRDTSGGYSLCLTAEQYEELQKYSVFAGINITYTMQNGNYVIKLTNAEYQIYLKNRQIAGPITSMQYNITMASGKTMKNLAKWQ